jgi:hypothetical protein
VRNEHLVDELREIFQDLLTDGSWTITPEEAKGLLYLTSPNLVLWSIKATQRNIARKHVALTPDEILDTVKRYINQANGDREASRTRPAQLVDLAAKQAAEQRRERAEEALMYCGREDERGR